MYNSLFREYYMRVSLLRQATIALLASSTLITPAALADDFVVSTPTTTFNGGPGNIIDGNDTLTITATGSITVNVGPGVLTSGAGNTITNFGSITSNQAFWDAINTLDGNTINNHGSVSTTGNNAQGIRALNNAIITNSGTITTSGGGSSPIHIFDNNLVTNSGSITTSGNSAAGIFANNDNNIVNSGSISTSGNGGSNGILVVDQNIITNSGDITTKGSFDSNGIWLAGWRNRVINTGNITTYGLDAEGLWLNGNGNIATNTGRITTFGDSSNAVRIDNSDNTFTNSGIIQAFGQPGGANAVVVLGAGATFNNSGKVVSKNNEAFSFSGESNTLNLFAPSFIGGTMTFVANDAISITTGASHSVLWSFQGTTNFTFAGPVPWAWNAATNQFATYDPTVFTAAPEALAQLSGQLSNIMQQRLEDGNGGLGGSNLNAYASTHESKGSKHINKAFGDASSTYGGDSGPKAWISAFGAYSNYDGTNATLDHAINHYGIVGGYDWAGMGDWKFGVLAGYGRGALDADSRFANSWDNKSNGIFIGSYGRKEMGNHFVDISLTGGIQDHSDKRFVNDNLAPLGVSFANSSYNSFWLSPEIAIGTHYDTGYGWEASPTARLRYASQWLDGYTETGPSAANAVVGSRHVAMGEASFEWAVTRKTEKSTIALRAGYQFRTSLGDDATSVAMIGQTISVPTFDEDRHSVYFGANTDFKITDTVSLNLGGRVALAKTGSGFSGNIKLVSRF